MLGFWGAVAVEFAGVVGFGGFGTVFFFTGFLGGSVSSTNTFFGGAGGGAAAACRSRTWVLQLRQLPFFRAEARVSIRSASDRRDLSSSLKSFCTDWNSSFEPNAPADSTTGPKTS